MSEKFEGGTPPQERNEMEKELLSVEDAMRKMNPDHANLPHVVLERTTEQKGGGYGKGGYIEFGEKVVREFPNLQEALSFARERLVSGAAGPHEDFINLKDDKFGLSENAGRWGAYSAYNALLPEEE